MIVLSYFFYQTVNPMVGPITGRNDPHMGRTFVLNWSKNCREPYTHEGHLF